MGVSTLHLQMVHGRVHCKNFARNWILMSGPNRWTRICVRWPPQSLTIMLLLRCGGRKMVGRKMVGLGRKMVGLGRKMVGRKSSAHKMRGGPKMLGSEMLGSEIIGSQISGSQISGSQISGSQISGSQMSPSERHA